MRNRDELMDNEEMVIVTLYRALLLVSRLKYEYYYSVFILELLLLNLQPQQSTDIYLCIITRQYSLTIIKHLKAFGNSTKIDLYVSNVLQMCYGMSICVCVCVYACLYKCVSVLYFVQYYCV